jgi:transcription antitermination factor NusG
MTKYDSVVLLYNKWIDLTDRTCYLSFYTPQRGSAALKYGTERAVAYPLAYCFRVMVSCLSPIPAPPGAAATHPWFALSVRPRHEKNVATYLSGKGYDQYLPLYLSRRQWSDRVKPVDLPLFGGYVFSRFDPLKRLPILTIPGVLSVVSFGQGPAPVDDGELSAIRRIAESGAPAEPWPFLKVGQRVRVERGPLAGVEGILLQMRSQSRIVVSVSLLQRSVAAEVGRDCISPILR